MERVKLYCDLHGGEEDKPAVHRVTVSTTEDPGVNRVLDVCQKHLDEIRKEYLEYATLQGGKKRATYLAAPPSWAKVSKPPTSKPKPPARTINALPKRAFDIANVLRDKGPMTMAALTKELKVGIPQNLQYAMLALRHGGYIEKENGNRLGAYVLKKMPVNVPSITSTAKGNTNAVRILRLLVGAPRRNYEIAKALNINPTSGALRDTLVMLRNKGFTTKDPSNMMSPWVITDAGKAQLATMPMAPEKDTENANT